MALIRNATILFTATMAGSVANYLFQFVMGRNLTLEEYGNMNALLSIMTGITLPATAVMLVVAKYSSTYSALGDFSSVASLYRGALVRVSVLALLAAAAFLLLSGYVADYLRIGSYSPFLILSAGVAASFLFTVNMGMLQGLQLFYWLGLSIGLCGVLRFGLGALSITAGHRLNGALLSTAVPALILFAVSIKPLSGYLKEKGGLRTHEKMIGYALPALLSTSAFAFLTNADLVMAKHYLMPADAGIYSSVAVLGKTLLYLPSSFALAVFPMVSVSDALNGDSFRILDRALLLTLAISSAALALFSAAPDLIMSLLFGERFLRGAQYLIYYGAAMTMMALVSIIISFNLARGKTAFIYPLILSSALLVLLISRYHSDIGEILKSMLAAFALAAGLNLWQIYRERQSYYGLKFYEFYKTPDGPDRGPA